MTKLRFTAREHLNPAKLEGYQSSYHTDLASFLTPALGRMINNRKTYSMEAIAAAVESMQPPQLPWATSISLRPFHMTLWSVPGAQKLIQQTRKLHDRGQARDREAQEAIEKMRVEEIDEDIDVEWRCIKSLRMA